MANDPTRMSREERLAAKLRENLRRRKAQSRAFEENTPDSQRDSAEPALPKSDAKS